MNTINKPIEEISQILPKQKGEDKKSYRKSNFLVYSRTSKGMLILNTMTDELIFLETSEQEFFENPDVENPISQYLIEHFYLVESSFSESKTAVQIKNVLEAINMGFREIPINNFVILTTTACNARCFYCFERGAKIKTMDLKTAHDVAKYIEKRGAKRVWLRWFGGEPLVNSKVIDAICNDLRDCGIIFQSSMITNGYLFDDNLISIAVDKWKMKDVQITLDGTEQVYNRTKNYVYKSSQSPFYKVIGNIERLLENKVFVKIRLNVDRHNIDDLFNLVDFLTLRFSKYSNCFIYAVQLFENSDFPTNSKTLNERNQIVKKVAKLQNYINKLMPNLENNEIGIKRKNPVNKCMASSDSSTTIMPDGKLGKCEHYIDSDFYGSIYSDDVNYEIIKKFKATRSKGRECERCKFYLTCLHLKCCTESKNCLEYEKIQKEQKLIQSMNIIYKHFTEKNGKDDASSATRYKLCIADFNTSIVTDISHFSARNKAYIKDFKSDDISVKTPSESTFSEKKITIELTKARKKTLSIVREFAKKIPCFGAFLFHSATIDVDGVGVAFAAQSGTGKTTQMLNWQKLFGDKMTIVNGDKPIIRFFDKDFCEEKGLDIPEGTEFGVPYAYGTPWRGKEKFGCNMRTPLKHICFIERSETNFVTKIEKHEAIDRIMKQVYIPQDRDALEKTLELVNRLINTCDLWIIHCNMEPESAKVAYETIIGE